MTIEAHSGEITKNNKHGKPYVFGFGWACQYILEEKYGPNLKGLSTAEDNASVIADVLLSALQTRQVNNIPDNFSKKDMFLLLDQFSEQEVKELWTFAKQALGFIARIADTSEGDVKKLADRATANTAGSETSKPA